jgi:hypothetical protein
MCDVWRLEIGIVRRTAELGIAYLQPPLPPAIGLDRYLFNVSISQSYNAVPGATYRMGRLRKALTLRACFEAASPSSMSSPTLLSLTLLLSSSPCPPHHPMALQCTGLI